MGLFTNRDDLPRGDKDKERRQVNPGYYGLANLKINFSAIFKETSYEQYTENNLTNLYLDLSVRHHKYADFQENLEVSGQSFGLGFSFEYL